MSVCVYVYMSMCMCMRVKLLLLLLLTHGGGEDDDPQHVHALAVAGDDLVFDVWRRRDLQEHGVAQVGVVVVRHHVHVVGLRLLLARAQHHGDQVCAVLRGGEGEEQSSLVSSL